MKEIEHCHVFHISIIIATKTEGGQLCLSAKWHVRQRISFLRAPNETADCFTPLRFVGTVRIILDHVVPRLRSAARNVMKHASRGITKARWKFSDHKA
jgi:hypothetical protein